MCPPELTQRKKIADTLSDNKDIAIVGHQGYEPLGGPFTEDVKIVDYDNGYCRDVTLECDGLCARNVGSPPGGQPSSYFW
jgi:hypothetical protein